MNKFFSFNPFFLLSLGLMGWISFSPVYAVKNSRVNDNDNLRVEEAKKKFFPQLTRSQSENNLSAKSKPEHLSPTSSKKRKRLNSDGNPNDEIIEKRTNDRINKLEELLNRKFARTKRHIKRTAKGVEEYIHERIAELSSDPQAKADAEARLSEMQQYLAERAEISKMDTRLPFPKKQKKD